MLRDSMDAPTAGYHVEQVEILFVRDFPADRIAEAWDDTVAATEALRTAFDLTNGIPAGCHLVEYYPEMLLPTGTPGCWVSWREADRCRRILFPDRVPWRISYWPTGRRLIWTFHHALLDGRSIARILRSFLATLGGEAAAVLPRSRWQAPTRESVNFATEILNRINAARISDSSEFPLDSSPPGPAVRHLGSDFADLIEKRAALMKTTAASLVIWAWGQALADFSGAGAVVVEQVRAGAPQPGTTGFTMNVLPLLIRRSDPADLAEFQKDLAALRRIESVSPADFASGVYPDMSDPNISTIMVEHATLHHSLGNHEPIESVVLHDRMADAMMATAHLAPDFRLEVGGPSRMDLLERWVAVLERFTS